MKVVALVSGGKDSCYNMLLCQKYGHEIVALANLLPAEASVDELDSFMFQTVGHQLVAAYAECTGIPLFRRRIKGTSKNTELRYVPTVHDEVEDLGLLLEHVKRVMPDVQAVSSGAIASDYQRLRVESVCARLGLVSLAFLWKQPQDQLLQNMIDAGIHAVIVKVAALGLSPERHLGLRLEEIQPTMHSLASKFGVNVCGEGGEFETLTLDCPLFKHGRIVLDSWHPVLVSPDAGGAPVGHMKVESFHVERKGELAAGATSAAALEPIEVPDRPELPQTIGQSEHEQCSLVPGQREGESLQKEFAQSAQGQTASSPCQVRIHAQPDGNELILIGCRWRGAGDGEGIATSSNAVRAADVRSQANGKTAEIPNQASREEAEVGDGEADAANSNGAPLAEVRSPAQEKVGAAAVGLQVGEMLHAVRICLGEQGLTWNNALYIRLYVADMAQFAEANKAYSSAIPDSECPLGVPSRATVETAFPSGPAQVALDVLACRHQGARDASASSHTATDRNLPCANANGAKLDKEVLHVRSISCWAPSCIGPYSQCTRYWNLLFMAGQLGLDPPLMELITPQTQGPTAADVAAAEMRRALLSCQAVAEAMRGSVRAHSLTLTVYCSPLVGAIEMEAVRAELVAFLRGPKGGPTSELHQDAVNTDGDGVTERDHLRRVNDWSSDLRASPAGQTAGSIEPCIVFLSVPALPKGAAVEVAPVVYLPDAPAAWDGEPTAVPSAFSFNEHNVEAVQPLKQNTDAVGSSTRAAQSTTEDLESRGNGVESDLQHLSLASRFTATNEVGGTGHAGSMAPASSEASEASAAAAAIPRGLHLAVRGHADEGALCSCHIWLYADAGAVLPLHAAAAGIVAEAIIRALARSLRLAALHWSDVLELRIHLPSQEQLLFGVETELAKRISSLEMTNAVEPLTVLVSGLHLPNACKGDVVLAHAQLSALHLPRN